LKINSLIKQLFHPQASNALEQILDKYVKEI